MSKKKKGTRKIYEEVLVYDFNNERALDLYNKLEYQLEPMEKVRLYEYINDYTHPTWKRVIFNGIETGYAVSNVGEVMNLLTGNILANTLDKDGYCRAPLKILGIWKHTLVHRLVAQAFIPNPENKPEVNHINANKTCNWYKNLEWCTNRENIDHAIAMGLEKHLGAKGEDNITSVYTEDQIRKVCEMLEDPNNTPKMIEKATGVSKIGIYHVRHRNIWTHISKDYKFHNVNFREGELNKHAIYSNETVHKICKMLEDPNNYPAKIAKELDVSSNVVRQIYRGVIRRDISCQYDIVQRSLSGGENAVLSKYTNEQIRKACELCKDPYIPYTEITRITGVNNQTICKIVTGKQWQDIAKEYAPFPDRIDKKSEDILALYDKGMRNSQIYEALHDKYFQNIDRRHGTLQIGDVIRRHNEKLGCSSTIEKAPNGCN